MNGDERLDRLVRASLEWEADRAAATQPSFERAMANLATRVGDTRATRVAPRIEGAPASRRALGILAAALLLAAALVALIVVGSRTEQPSSDLDPGLFGLAAPCTTALADGVAHELTLPDERRRVRFHSDGQVLHVRSPDVEALAHPGSESTFSRQQLSATGVAAVKGVVDRLRLTPGCRVHAGAPVAFVTRLDAGFARFETGGWPGAYRGYDLLRWMTLGEDQIATKALEDLTTNLAELVGPGGWVDRMERPVDATAWLPEPVVPEATRPPLPVGDLHALDPCDLLPAAALGADQRISQPSPLSFSYASLACEYLAGQRRIAMLSVRGQSTTIDDAEIVVDGLFGGDPTRGLAQRRFNPCWLDRRNGCPYAIAAWSEGHLAVLVFPPATIGGRPDVTLEEGGALMAQVMARLSR
jgi:hypothetical protein